MIAFAVKYNVTKDDAEQVAVLSDNQLEKLRQVYLDMNVITTTYETTSKEVEVTTTNGKGEKVTKTRIVTTTTKIITIDSLTAEDIGEIYGFDDVQNHMIAEMRQSGYGVLMASSNVKKFLTREEINAIQSYIPEGVTIESEKVVEAAESFVGKVNYFWGGKSLAIGWDERFGTDMEVTSPGSSSTGTIRPFGLDCSGFVTWAFVNAGLPAESIESTISHGTTAQWNVSTSIPASTATLGDLAFLATPGTRKVNHIGIVVGRNADGQILVAHCSSGANNVSIATDKLSDKVAGYKDSGDYSTLSNDFVSVTKTNIYLPSEPFEPSRKTSPSNARNVIIGALLGGMVSVALVLIKEYWFKPGEKDENK